MRPLEAFLFAVFLIAFFGIIAYGVVRVILDNLHTNRTRRLWKIQEQWRRIDYSSARTFDSKQELRSGNWKATSMTWVMTKDGWKGWGRGWVDDDQ